MNDASENRGAEPERVDLNAGAQSGDSRHALATALMIGSSVLISFGGLIIRNMHDADAWQINFYRSIGLAAGVLVILAFYYRGQVLASVRGIGRSGVFGGALLAAAGICFLQSLTHTTVANTLFILSAIPFFAAALAWVVLREPLRRSTLAAMLIAAIGLAVMVHEGFRAGSGYGNAMALTTALCFAVYAVIVRRKRRVNMLPTLLVSSMLIMSIALVMRFDDLGISWHDFLLCMLWGGLLSGLANWMFIVATRYLSTAEVTLFMLLEFALGPAWVWLFIGETPGRWTLVGGVMVIAAVATRALIQIAAARPRPITGG